MGLAIPQSKSEWIDEIAETYHDAGEAIPFGNFTRCEVLLLPLASP